MDISQKRNDVPCKADVGEKWGLSAYQLKIIALIVMTLDHIAAYGFEISFIAEYSSYLRTIGRIAAPIFLFLLVQSISHTRSKSRFLLRLYLAGVCVGLFDAGMNLAFGETLGYVTPPNIIFTFFYTAFYAIFIEKFIAALKNRDIRQIIITFAAIIISLMPSLMFDVIYSAVPAGNSTAERFLFQGLRESFIPSFYDVDYGIGFILLGVAMYFAGTKKRQCLVFAAFCVICIVGAFAADNNISIYSISFYGFFSIFFDYFQCRMVLALPFLMLYNGKRGKSRKGLFYGYYPLHRQIMRVLFALIK